MVYIGNIWVLDPPHAWTRGAPKGGTQSGPLNRRPSDPLGVQKMSKPDIYLDPRRSQKGHVGFIQPLPVLSAIKRVIFGGPF